MRFARWLVCALALITTLNLVAPSVHAQQTSIIDLTYPRTALFDLDSSTLDAPTLISTTVAYHNAKPGDYLMVEIFQLVDGSLAKGSAFSTSNCIPTVQSYAVCIIGVRSESGSSEFRFSLTSRPMRYWNLAIIAMLTNSSLSPIYDSESDSTFTITVYTALGLQITVPDSATVSVDGRNVSQGSDRLSLIAGIHNVSVPDTLNFDNDTRMKFQSWSDGSTQPNRTVLLNHSIRLKANYVTQYQLKIESTVPVSGAGWYDQGINATISANASEPMDGILGALGGRWEFQGWYENGRLIALSNTTSIQMNGPHSIAANWSPNYTIPLIIIAGIAMVTFYVIYCIERRGAKPVRRKSRLSRSPGAKYNGSKLVAVK